MLMGKLTTVPPGAPVNPELGRFKYALAGFTVML